ncbi:hypothetical protein [Nocardioides convexus]|uniref:hypothetical protein n=1 Tax=Nocardioides convexus TaxID=2712224 RepID=UPI002418B089|nr:hypothetical protein [Nocardioides convexus]
MPGVPDVYQGSEPVGAEPGRSRQPATRGLRAAAPAARRGGAGAPGRPGRRRPRQSLHVVRTALRLRRERPDLFARYQPLSATGAAAGHLLAFDRGGAIAVVTRLPLGLERAGGWRDTRLDLPPGEWRDVLTDRPATGEVGSLLADLPVALLVREDA